MVGTGLRRRAGPRECDPAALEPVQGGLTRWIERELAAHVPFERMCVGLTDPWTGLVTTNESTDYHDLPAAYIEAEYQVPDVNSIASLAGRACPVGVLSEATGGVPERSHRYRNLMRPHGLRHELRAALVADGSCWGYVILLRTDEQPDFTAAEAALVCELAPRLAATIRAGVLDPAVRADRTAVTGMAIVDGRGTVEAADDDAARLLDRLARTHARDDLRLAVPVATMAAALNASQQPGARHALVAEPALGWLTVQGRRLTARNGGNRFVISVAPARPLAVAPLLLRARGLTDRETTVALQVLRGLTTAEVAEHLAISPYTVQDHLKRTFTKVGVNSRRQLIGALFPGTAPSDLF